MFERKPEAKPESEVEAEIRREAAELEKQVNALYRKLESSKESLLSLPPGRLGKVAKFFDDHSITIYMAMLMNLPDPARLALQNTPHGKWEEVAINLGLGIAVGQMLEAIGRIFMEESKKHILREELRRRKNEPK